MDDVHMSDDDTITLNIQGLIDSGMAWQLEGSIGRTCMDAIKNGQAMLGEKAYRDHYGNYVPTRYEVASNTPGSVEFYEAHQEVSNL